MPAADPVARTEVLELLSGKGGERLAAEGAAVSFRRTDEAVVPKLVGSVASETDSVALGGPTLGVECEPVPVTRAPVDTNAEVVLVKGNGSGLVLVLSRLLVGEVDLLVVKMREALVVLDTDKTVCEIGPTIDVVLFSVVEKLEMAETVALGVKIDRGNVLRIDKGDVEVARLALVSVFVLSSTNEEESVLVDTGEDVMGGKLVSIVTLVRFPEEGLDVKVGPDVTPAEEVLVAEAVPEDVKTAEEFLEKEFLSVKLGLAEVFKASALVSVAPEPVEESFDVRLVKVVVGVETETEVEVEAEVEVDVVTIKAVDVLEVEIVVTVHGPFVCHGPLV